MEPISYKGFVIAKETEPWAIKFKRNFFFYPEGDQGPSDTWNNGFETIEQAKDAIDEHILDEMDKLERTERYLRSLMNAKGMWDEYSMKEWETKLERAQRESIALWNQYKAA